jgi:probable rRNA maturation factor
VTGDHEPDTICIAADGLELEISAAEGATALHESLPAVIAAAIAAASRVVGPVEGGVTIIVDNDSRIRVLNQTWRQIDKPTNVLSFPAPDGPSAPSKYLGDIAISYETAAREAAAEGKSFSDHVAHLSVHGFLHLLGYDHESDADAAEMEGLEREILARVGVSDPYIADTAEG